MFSIYTAQRLEYGYMATVTSTVMTVEEFSRLPADGARHEMNAGELITLPPPKSLHSLTSLAVLEALQAYLRQHPWDELFRKRATFFPASR